MKKKANDVKSNLVVVNKKFHLTSKKLYSVNLLFILYIYYYLFIIIAHAHYDEKITDNYLLVLLIQILFQKLILNCIYQN